MVDHHSVRAALQRPLRRRHALALAGGLASLAGVSLLAACGGTNAGAVATTTRAATSGAARVPSTTSSTAAVAASTASITATSTAQRATSASASTAMSSVVATTSSQASAAPSSKAGSLHVLYYPLTTPTSKTLWEQSKATFTQQHPGVTIIEDLTSDLFTKMPTLVAAGTPPDVAPLRSFGELIMFAPYGVLQEIDPYMARSTVVPKADFYEKTLAGNSVAGKLYALPTTVDMDGLFYNEDLFDAAGVKYPDLTWDYTDWLNAAEKLTKRQGDTITQAGGLVPDWWVIQYLGNVGVAPWQGGVDEPGACSRVNYDRPDVIKGFQWYQDVTCKNPVNLTAQGQKDQGIGFPQGNAAMLLSYDQRNGFVTAVKGKFRWNWTLAPLGDKQQPRKQTTNFYGDGIFAQSPVKDLAWSWLEITDAPAAQVASVKALGAASIYANRKVQESPDYLASPIPPTDKQVLVEGLNTAAYVPQPFWEMKALKIQQPAAPAGAVNPDQTQTLRCGVDLAQACIQQAQLDNAALKQHGITVCS